MKRIKITRSKFYAIRKAIKLGVKPKEICERIDVVPSTITKILQARNFKEYKILINLYSRNMKKLKKKSYVYSRSVGGVISYIKFKMSMRATFTTEYIYDGSEGQQERSDKMRDVLMAEKKNSNYIGQISGITSGSDLSEQDIKGWIDEMCYELSKVTIVPFKIVWLLESGDIIIKEIRV